MGDGAPSDGSSTVATLMAFEGSDLHRLNSGFGSNSVSSRKKSSGSGGSGFSKAHGRLGLRSGMGGVELNVMSVSSEAEAIPSTCVLSKLFSQRVAIHQIGQGTKREMVIDERIVEQTWTPEKHLLCKQRVGFEVLNEEAGRSRHARLGIVVQQACWLAAKLRNKQD